MGIVSHFFNEARASISTPCLFMTTRGFTGVDGNFYNLATKSNKPLIYRDNS